MIKELENPLTKEYLKFKELILNEKTFPWYFVSAYSDGNDQNFSFYSHTILNRGNPPTITSPKIFDECLLVLNQILKFNGIEFKILHRINLNSVHYFSSKHNNPHVDHDYPHKNILIYLNENITGNTIIFNEKYLNYSSLQCLDSNHNLTIKKEIVPKENKVVIFDGDYYHCHKSPDSITERRVVLVCTCS